MLAQEWTCLQTMCWPTAIVADGWPLVYGQRGSRWWHGTVENRDSGKDKERVKQLTGPRF